MRFKLRLADTSMIKVHRVHCQYMHQMSHRKRGTVTRLAERWISTPTICGQVFSAPLPQPQLRFGYAALAHLVCNKK